MKFALVFSLASLSALAACTATTGATPSSGDDDPGGRGGDDRGGGGGSAGTGDARNMAGVGGATPSSSIQPGFIGIHRLNNTEYDNTVRDLLGVRATPAATFIAGEEALGFDNIAAALGMTTSQFEQYFNAAESLTAEAIADTTLRGRIMTCTPSSTSDRGCLTTIIKAFGERAWRRPLDDAETARLLRVADDAAGMGEDINGTVRHVITAMLTAVPFLYRMELDADPGSKTPRQLNPWELASRLSYLLWSSMPDDALFASARSGKLLSDEELGSAFERMLADRHSDGFVDGFAGQWLGFRRLLAHQVDPSIFKDWDEPARLSMLQEGRLYFREFLDGNGRSMKDFFSARFTFINTRLARHYGLPTVSGWVRLENVPQRIGFLGLGAFLTETSFSYRTSPTKRGVTILRNLLCEELPDPPANVPELDQPGDTGGAANQNVRDRLAQHRTNPACAACHKLFDPAGLGLETFDAVGRYRARYPNGDAIDSSGVLPDGKSFKGLEELANILASDQRLAGCTLQRLLIYAQGRALTPGDDATLESLRASWESDGLNLHALVRRVVMSEAFRARQPEGAK